jgi:VIT1/CCC1 family predicted Fe2+/Mn2+ transporter
MDAIDAMKSMTARERLDSEPLPRQELVRRSLLSMTFGVVLPILVLLLAGLGLVAVASGS